MRTILNKLKTLWKDLGPINAPLYLLHKALSVPTGGRAKVERFIFVAQPIHDTPLLPPGKAATSIVRQINPGDPLLSQCPRPAAVIADRYAQGAICLAIVKNDILQAFLWLIHKHYDEDVARVRFVLPPSGKAVWDFDVYVAPAYRLGYTFLKLWDTANAHLREHGVRWSLSRISAFNAGSLSSHSKLGARPIGSATFIIAGPLQIMTSSLSPKFHLSFGQSRPKLLMPENLA
ncbi:MAG: N-acetyltransferase family protein [Thiobacillus sp.]